MEETNKPQVILELEGQEFPLSPEYADKVTDEKLRMAFTTLCPWASTAIIHRTERNGQVVITFAKQTGTKGSGEVLEALLALPETRNPAILLAQRLKVRVNSPAFLELDPDLQVAQLSTFTAEIDTALEEGQKTGEEILETLKTLLRLPPVPSFSREF